MKFLYLLLAGCLFYSCSPQKEEESISQPEEKIKLTRFNGNYNKGFNDLHELHLTAAKKNGIKPLISRQDTSNIGDGLVRIPKHLAFYKTADLTHSIPYLVPKACDLLTEISINFRDSLVSKGIPPHRLIITSITRTDEDIKKLTKRNMNASHTSAHCYGTTFDISWKRFEKENPFCEEVNPDKLKFVLGQVLHDLRQRKKCYIKHEKKQACFHITVS